MDSDKATTVTGAITAVSGVTAALAAIVPQIDPNILALIPPPYNMYVMIGLVVVMGISHFAQSVMTNKKVVTVKSDSQQSTPGAK